MSLVIVSSFSPNPVPPVFSEPFEAWLQDVLSKRMKGRKNRKVPVSAPGWGSSSTLHPEGNESRLGLRRRANENDRGIELDQARS